MSRWISINHFLILPNSRLLWSALTTHQRKVVAPCCIQWSFIPRRLKGCQPSRSWGYRTHSGLCRGFYRPARLLNGLHSDKWQMRFLRSLARSLSQRRIFSDSHSSCKSAGSRIRTRIQWLQVISPTIRRNRHISLRWLAAHPFYLPHLLSEEREDRDSNPDTTVNSRMS